MASYPAFNLIITTGNNNDVHVLLAVEPLTIIVILSYNYAVYD